MRNSLRLAALAGLYMVVAVNVVRGVKVLEKETEGLDAMEDIQAIMGTDSFRNTFSSLLPSSRTKTLADEEEDVLAGGEDGEAGRVIRAVVHRHLHRDELGEAGPAGVMDLGEPDPAHKDPVKLAKNLIEQKRQQAAEVMKAEKKRWDDKRKEGMSKRQDQERVNKRDVVEQENEDDKIKKLEEKAEEADRVLPVVPSDQEQQLAKRGNDPGADERISLLKDKIVKAKARLAFSKSTQVATDAKEMSFKVMAGSAEAKKAHATLEDITEKAPSLEDMANERIKKSRDRFELKELNEKAKPLEANEASSPSKKKKSADVQPGAAVAVELRAAMTEAKKAMQYKDDNPGDRKAELDAADAINRVAKLTKAQEAATVNDGHLQQKASAELETKYLKIATSKELEKKRETLKNELSYAANQRAVNEKAREKEVLEKEVANADRNLRIEKQMAKLAEERERTNLEKREWESHEASVKDDYKAKEDDKLKTVQRKEMDVKMSDKVKEGDEKMKLSMREEKEKAAIKKSEKIKQDENEKKMELEADKASVIKLIQDAKNFKLKANQEKQEEVARLERLARRGKNVAKEAKEFQEKDKERKEHEKAQMTTTIDRLTVNQAKSSSSLVADKKTEHKLKIELKKLQADDEADDQKSAEAAEAAKEKGAKATAKSKIDNKMTVYEEHLKEKVEMEVNGPFKEMLQARTRRDVKLKAELQEAMESAATKSLIARKVASVLKKRLKERVYTVGEAKELDKLVSAEIKNQVENRIFTRLSNEDVAGLAAKEEDAVHAMGGDDQQGVFMKPGAQAESSSLQKLSVKEQNRVIAAIRQDDKRDAEMRIFKTEQENKEKPKAAKDPRQVVSEMLDGGPKPWYNKTAL